MIQPSDDGFWATVELLVNGVRDVTCNINSFNDDIEDWLDTVVTKIKVQCERAKRKVKGDIYLSDDNNDDEEWSSCNSINLIDYSFTNPPVRSRLEMLMGSNVVRLTDRKYMLRLVAKIRQDYENHQQKRIEERKKNELMRTKTMILNRLISIHDAPIEIRQYPLFQLYLYCDAIVAEKRKKYSHKQKKSAASLYRILYPVDKVEEKSDVDEKEIYMKRIYVDGVPELIPMTSEETIIAKRELEAAKDIEDGYMLTQREFDRLHYETDAIKDLRETQRVEEMYSKAHEILGILYSHVDNGRYKKRLTAEKKASVDPVQSQQDQPQSEELHLNTSD
ncbi:hypothetical protein PV327_007598 [Microctonus hyperodae]|uniref:Uncharacterized protein n=1 Tax=Microctonus hyperodae TaxID=165561 RepID=A0AA39KYT2_MICHY|nr:hypothetical protein PV327_007598 [Microctonus hyperodae]